MSNTPIHDAYMKARDAIQQAELELVEFNAEQGRRYCEATARTERLTKLLDEAFTIINDCAPGYTVWLDAAERELGRTG